MIIKLTEVEGRWDLLATASNKEDDRPVYAAWGRTRAQIETVLSGILDEAPTEPASPPKGSGLAAAKRMTLEAMLTVLDGWVAGARVNHTALDHQREVRPCWTRFDTDDIRRMVADTAREVGLNDFTVTA